MIKDNDKSSASAYNRLKAADAEGQMETAEVTEEERAEFIRIREATEAMKKAFLETYRNKIKSDIGAARYNRLRKDLKTDDALKAKYQAIYAQTTTNLRMEEESVEEN
jgi:hypothetical protein